MGTSTIKLIPLKSEKFTYSGKTYTTERYITDDMKFYISRDPIDFVLVFGANEIGKGNIIYEVYRTLSYSQSPLYTIEDAVTAISKLDNREYTFTVNDSQFDKMRKPLIFDVPKL